MRLARALCQIEGRMEERTITETEERLPRTRKEAFFACYRENLGRMARLALRCTLSLLPAIITLWLKESYFDGLSQELPEATAEAIAAVRHSTDALFGIFENLSMLFFVLFLPGTLQVIRQLLWRELLIFKEDYRKGIRCNGGRCLLAALPVCLIDAVLKWCIPSTPTMILRAVWAVVLLPICAWFLLQTVYYQLKIRECFRNAAILYTRTWPVTLLLLLLTALPGYIGSVVGYLHILKYLALLIAAFALAVPMAAVWMLYACDIFDKYINRKHHPDYYRKGLQR